MEDKTAAGAVWARYELWVRHLLLPIQNRRERKRKKERKKERKRQKPDVKRELTRNDDSKLLTTKNQDGDPPLVRSL